MTVFRVSWIDIHVCTFSVVTERLFLPIVADLDPDNDNRGNLIHNIPFKWHYPIQWAHRLTYKTNKCLLMKLTWVQPVSVTAEMHRPVRRINPDWVGWLEVQHGSCSVDHHFCWWFAVAFISFTLATARSLCGWRLIAGQHMVPLASDHSTTCLSNCVSLPPT